MIRPSEKMSREPAGIDPGCMPPTSEWCARLTA
jgi:hypothetical protein